MGQGHDRGTQYRSAIYPTTPAQLLLASAGKAVYEKALRDKNAGQGKVITSEIRPVTPTTLPDGKKSEAVAIYYAEDYHQQYLAKPGSRKYCSAMPTGVNFPDIDTSTLKIPTATPKNVVDDVKKESTRKLNDAFWEKHFFPGCVLNVPNDQIVWKA
eukprot:g2792.t1